MTDVTLPTGIANMTSGALLTGIAILAAAAFQAGYVEKFRWRVWSGLPLYTSITSALATVAGLETFVYLAGKGSWTRAGSPRRLWPERESWCRA